MNEKIGQYLIRLDLLSFEQAEKVLNIQVEQSHKRFGEIAMELGYITDEDLEDFIKTSR